eukprot:scaffold26910_cov52-Attheya_sp.AAC.3
MRVSTLAVAAAVASIVSPTSAFVQRRPNPSIFRQRHAAPLSMVSTEPTSSSSSSSSSAAAEEELQHHAEAVMSGTVLEDGPVMDFGSLKASSRAEVALSTAREQYLASKNAATAAGDHTVTSTLMGINEEVVEQVGHELGTYCTAQEVQDCAAWLRNGKQSNTNTADQCNEETLLEKAYVESGEVTEAFAKTFYLGTRLLPPAAQKAIWAVYVWCRRTDEIVDAPRAEGDTDMLIDLAAWEHRLHQLWDPAQGNQVVDVLDLPLLDVHLTYPDLDIQPFLDMIRGMLMDIDGLDNIGQERYQTFDELHLYCYRVAGTVGLMSMPIFKTAPGFTELQAKEPALSLGVAFQLTNILRDVGEDAEKRGRVYLPQEDLERFGVTEQQLFEKRVDDNYIRLMKFEIDRARMYYERALRGVPMLSDESRLPVQSSLDCYGKILQKIEENGYDSLNQRAYVSKWEKLAEIPFSWYRTLEIAKVVPLPFDNNKPKSTIQ